VKRQVLLERLADAVDERRRPHPVRVALDGPDAAGKTTLADELGETLRRRGRHVVRASIDGFHRPRTERYRRGTDSPAGYYEDSFDLDALRRVLLQPLGPGGSREYRTAVFDVVADAPRAEPLLRVPDDAVLLLDGVFLLRPELCDVWDLRVFASVEPEETLRRALVRDRGLHASAAELERRYRTRYIPAQLLYLGAVRPEELADLVVVNDDPARPRLARP
jgi:uridine kinase